LRIDSKSTEGFKVFSDDPLWLPNTSRPYWLDGNLVGDRGFDPLALAKPIEFVQIEIDQLDQNQAVNKSGQLVGPFKSSVDLVTSQSLQPYSEVFGVLRFRECELIHGRWSMLATLGIVIAESATGVSWVEAGKVEIEATKYLDFNIPLTITQLCWIEAIAVGGAELYRNSELSSEKRIYPGGLFDPIGLATPPKSSSTQIKRLREAEIKHGRLAMIAFLGMGIQALFLGEGALGSLDKISSELQ